MKNIEVTYDALICENGTYEQGEAAFILPMTDELAAEYLAGRATDRGAVNLVETALEAVEVMSMRNYYLRREEAINVLSSVLWGYTSTDCEELINRLLPE